MENNLRQIVDRYEELAQLMMDPAVLQDQDRYLLCVREHAELEAIAAAAWDLENKLLALSDSEEIFQESDDAELRELARSEIKELEEAIDLRRQEISALLAPKDPRDQRSIIVEIRAGAGGEEAALFAGVLFHMYLAFAESKKLQIDIVDSNETELGGMKEVLFELTGQGAYSLFRFESGVHRVQRVPVTESGGRIHTSTCTVAVMPEADEVEVDINPSDLQIDTYRASGAGGQHVNKTSSAIRITHIPTGTVVTCQDERSQHKNKEKAMRVLRTRLFDQAQMKAQGAEAQLRKKQVGSGDRSERIRTYNYHQGRVSDHRIGLTLYKMDDILAGDLNELIAALSEAERSETLGRGEGGDN